MRKIPKHHISEEGRRGQSSEANYGRPYKIFNETKPLNMRNKSTVDLKEIPRPKHDCQHNISLTRYENSKKKQLLRKR